MQQKVIQIGNSAGIIIPKLLLEQASLKVGEELMLEVVPSRQSILIRKEGKKNKDIFSLTLGFFVMLEDFNKKHGKALRELAKR